MFVLVKIIKTIVYFTIIFLNFVLNLIFFLYLYKFLFNTVKFILFFNSLRRPNK